MDDTRVPMKYMLWEEAKGKLRALSAVQGSYPALSGNTEKWQQLDASVEEFIKLVEDNELYT